jgi:ABC-2 type transport system permease protein
MSPIFLICQRELASFFRGTAGYLIAAALLLIDGLLFHAFALGGGERLSSQVMENFFWTSFGTTAIAGVLVSMKLIAEERHDETLVLLYTAPISDWQIALGKWLAAFVFLAVMKIGLSSYLPLMVVVNGSLSGGHLLAGYLGLLLVGATTTALGTFASSLTRSQLLAAVLGAVMVGALVLMWLLSKIADPPFDGIFAYLALFDKHFASSFRKGAIHSRDVVFFLSVTFMALLGTRQVLGARRWS